MASASDVAPPFRAVVFDLDGTLVDTAPDLHAHLNEMLAELGRAGLELAEIRPLIGDGAKALLKRGLEASGGVPASADLDALFLDFLTRYTARPLRFGAPYDGVAEVLQELHAAGVRLGVCTNTAQAPSERLLAELGLARYLPVVIGGDSLAVKKPHAGHVQAVLERLGSRAARAVMVGDSENDLLAARAAALPCILVSFGYTPIPARELGADLVIDRMDELPDALAALAATPTARADQTGCRLDTRQAALL
ncbi:MAG TPA: phosphoglycolate phosphatase [Geminicoccaceae bacterium]|nr:phosphoglycolate phosphatase [Geminicoccaceae bacterium]